MIALALALTLASATTERPIGTETTIPFAGNGGLRNWQAGPARSGIVYVRDRRERWYEVTLSGPCATDRALDRLDYTTDVVGTFDRFSRIAVGRYPNRVCGVTRIRTSLPPRGQPGHRSNG